MDVHCEYRETWLKIHKVSVCDIVSRDHRRYLPKKRTHLVLFQPARIEPSCDRNGRLDRCDNAIDNELHPNGEEEEPEDAIDNLELFFSDAPRNNVGVNHRVINHKNYNKNGS